jgi:hypothetical protein
MKKEVNFWLLSITFIFGSFVSYCLTQFNLLQIKLELNVPDLLINIITILTGFYIANTIQHQLSKKQNRSTFLVSKLEKIWVKFSELSAIVNSGSNIQVSTVNSIYKEISNNLDYFKSISSAYSINSSLISELETLLDLYENQLISVNISKNVIQVIFPATFKPLEDNINSKFIEILSTIS